MEKRSRFSKYKPFFLQYVFSLSLLILLSFFFSHYLYTTKATEEVKGGISTSEVPVAISQSLIFLFAAIIATLLVLYLIMKRRLFALRTLYISAFSIAVFIFLSLFLQPLYSFLSSYSEKFSFAIVLLSNFFISVFLMYGIFNSKSNFISNTSIIMVACIVGSILGGVLEFIQLVIFLIIFAIYDIIAVFLGPLKRIAKEMESIGNGPTISEYYFKGMFLNFQQIEIGIGDLLLYSAMISNLSITSFQYFFFSLLGVSIGSLLTIILASKFKLFPGLPLPVFITLSLIFL